MSSIELLISSLCFSSQVPYYRTQTIILPLSQARILGIILDFFSTSHLSSLQLSDLLYLFPNLPQYIHLQAYLYVTTMIPVTIICYPDYVSRSCNGSHSLKHYTSQSCFGHCIQGALQGQLVCITLDQGALLIKSLKYFPVTFPLSQFEPSLVHPLLCKH